MMYICSKEFNITDAGSFITVSEGSMWSLKRTTATSAILVNAENNFCIRVELMHFDTKFYCCGIKNSRKKYFPIFKIGLELEQNATYVALKKNIIEWSKKIAIVLLFLAFTIITIANISIKYKVIKYFFLWIISCIVIGSFFFSNQFGKKTFLISSIAFVLLNYLL